MELKIVLAPYELTYLQFIISFFPDIKHLFDRMSGSTMTLKQDFIFNTHS